MKLTSDELESLRRSLKRVVKGRPLYFGLMAPGSKKGKFRLSRLKNEVKPTEIKKNFKPYENAKDNDIKGSACEGVVTAERGTLQVHCKGKPPGAAPKFLHFLVIQRSKCRFVRRIEFPTVTALPAVPDTDPPLEAEEVRKRLTELAAEVGKRRSASPPLSEQSLKSVIGFIASADAILKGQPNEEQLEEADDLIVDAWGEFYELVGDTPQESAIDSGDLETRLERARNMTAVLPPGRVSGIASRMTQGRAELKEENLEAAQETILGLEDEIDGTMQDYFLEQLRSITQAGSQLPPEILKAVEPCRQAIRRRDWEAATQAWMNVRKLAQQLKAGQETAQPPPPPPPPPPTDKTGQPELTEDPSQLQAWQKRHDELKQTLTALLKDNPEALDPAGKKALLDLFLGSELLAKRRFDYSRATMVHGRIRSQLNDAAGLVAESSTETSIEPGTVAFRKSMLRWEQGLKQVASELDRLKNGIREASQDDADMADELDVVLRDFEGTLDDVLVQGINAEDDNLRLRHRKKALTVINGFRKRASTSELIAHLDNCRFCQVRVRDTLEDALDDLVRHLNAFVVG